METTGVTKKIMNVVIKIFTYIMVAITVFMMVFTIFSVSTFDKNDRSLFGIKFYIVQSDSMSPSELNKNDEVHFSAGDIVLVKELEPAEKRALKKGDVIAFVSQNTESRGETVTHMVYDVKIDDATGRVLGYLTYGTNTGTVDESLVEPDYVLGKYTGKLPKVGYFFAFLKTTPGYIVCILVPFLLLILYQGVNCIVIFKRYRKEQLEEMEAEKAQIAEERKQSMEMMRELAELKAQLAQQNTAQQANAAENGEAKADGQNDTASEKDESASEKTDGE